MSIFSFLGHLLFPPKCILCGKLLEKEEIDLCRECRSIRFSNSIIKNRWLFLDSFFFVWYYEGNVRKSLLRYKFRGARRYAPAYGRMLAMRISQELPEGFDMLTWIPVSAKRKASRGYDQVELIARAVGRELGMKPIPLLKKVRDNPPQSSLTDDSMRKRNVSDVYQFRGGADISGKRILLLDDILTTGATAEEAARILLCAGAEEVHCAAMAAARK